MSKRSWHEANLQSPRALASAAQVGSISQNATSVSPAQSHASHQSRHSSTYDTSPRRTRPSFEDPPNAKSLARPSIARNPSQSNGASDNQRLPGISRKVKACAACRKQKIKCIMVGDPPCQRCKERGLSCKLNKSLQTLMSEDSKWKSSVTKDVTAVYGSLERVLQLLNLPELPPLHLSAQDPAIFFDTEDPNAPDDDDEHSADNSPKVTPVTDNLSHVPIESLYQITGLKSLRAAEGVSEEQHRICKQLRDTDFISRGMVKVEDAEYLADLYLKKLDPYIWHLASEYTDLESFRSRSPTLTACVLAVASLHDIERGPLYQVCSKEYRRLVANAMFERKIDMEYLRALVIGSYWLSDISWTLSGYAIRRASEFQFKQCYQVIADSSRGGASKDQAKLQESMSGIRVLYLLYICDHHLSVLYGRSSIMRDNESYITGWEAYISCSLAVDADRRIAGQICLMYLMNQVREVLGPEDNNSVLPASAATDIARFEANLDDWISRFSRHNPHSLIGNWPTKGAVLHYHWAKLYLTSYSLRGLDEKGATIPSHFLETASSAVAAATSIITLLLEDKDAHVAIAYVPHHVHGMIAFATMFLLKVATKHAEQLSIDKAHLSMLMAALARQFKATVVGKDHLIHRMAEGLEKMAEMLHPHNRRSGNKSSKKEGLPPLKTSDSSMRQPLQPGLTQDSTGSNTATPTNGNMVSHDTGSSNGNVTQYDSILNNAFDFGDPALGLGMPFFDFEGTTLNPGDTVWNFPS